MEKAKAGKNKPKPGWVLFPGFNVDFSAGTTLR